MESDTLRVYDQAAAAYDAEPNSVLFTETAAVLALLDLRKGDALLDAACGTGKYVREGLKGGADCVGLDFSREMLALAAAKCPGARFVRHDLMSPPLPFAGGAFGKIILAHALWHLAGVAALFAEFARLLGPGGRLVVTVTHPEAAFKRFEYRREDCPGGDEIDISKERRRYTLGEITAAALSAGLRPAAAETIQVDERLRPVLTEESYARVRGTPLILALRFDKP
ncbi:MAG: type 11 methyltransferase [Elusimicrobia bacterium]|nr:MAG: type 11 methyltransferase [Elusimicrobiota bacterium]KAF0153661.1 MAG: type 11 methyltransferase [Elusimicrobiota bacterium]